MQSIIYMLNYYQIKYCNTHKDRIRLIKREMLSYKIWGFKDFQRTILLKRILMLLEQNKFAISVREAKSYDQSWL